MPPLFTKEQLRKLIFPLIIEQILAVTIGMADSVMVASVGEAAISGVSLVDQINMLLISILSALATGGAVIASQYLGRQDRDSACGAAKQLVFACAALSCVVMAATLLFRGPLLRLLYGSISADVMTNAETYFLISALSYPFIALYNAGAALFRAMGNSKISMTTSILMNVINVCGNAILIYGFGMGVAGAAIATLVARMAGSVFILVLLRSTANTVFVRNWRAYRPDFAMIRRILGIGVPSGLENGMFQIGKVLVASLVATYGTASITANSVAGNICMIPSIPGTAIGLSMITVIGQCVGAGDIAQARHYTKSLMGKAMLWLAILNIPMYFLCPYFVGIYDVAGESARVAIEIIRLHSIFCIGFWPLAFTLPNALRAAGDAKFTMTVSVITMWTCRIGLSWLFGTYFGIGVLGIWMAMVTDWVVRALAFVLRFRSHRWETKKAI